MSEKQSPGKQTNHSKATALQKKPKSKRKTSSARRGKPSNKNLPALIATAKSATAPSSAQMLPTQKQQQAQRATAKHTSKRSNHNRAGASVPEKRPEHDLKQEETDISAEPESTHNGTVEEPGLASHIVIAEPKPGPSDTIAGPEREPDGPVAEASQDSAFDRDGSKDFTFFDALVDLDAFLFEDVAEEGRDELGLYIEAPATAPLAGIEQDAFLLEDEAGIVTPEGDQAAADHHAGPSLPSQPPSSPLAAEAVSSIDEYEGDQAGAGHHEAPPQATQPSSPLPISSEGGNASQEALMDEGGSGDVAVLEQGVLPEIIDTPLPASIEEDEIREAPYSVQEWYPEGEPIPDTPLPSFSSKPWYERKPAQVLRKVAALCLLALLIVSSILLWHDVTDTHLYVYTLDPSTGNVLAQQDIGGGYQGKTTITDPVQVGSTLVFGVRTAQTPDSVKQRVLALTGRGMSWHVDNEFAAGQAQGTVPTTSGTLSTTAGGHLVVENANGLQVMTANGRLLWSMQGDQPALGAHAFQPTSGSETLYDVKSARLGEVAAFDLANGALRWMETLNDTFNYSPPLLLSVGILYIAGDHNLYALNSVDGSLLWQKQWPARSFFVLNNGGASLLLAVGPQGLAAFDSATGTLTWSFNGQPGNKTIGPLTAAQFYQAGIDSGNNVIYATGIVWDALQVREQLWLYAVDGTTGTLRWSEPIGSGLSSADAGRVFTPLVDTADGLVAVEQEQDNGDYSITTFDAATGASRWNTHFDGEAAAAPVLLQAPSDALLHLKIPRGKKHLNSALANIPDTILILPVTQSSIPTALQSWSHLRILLLVLIGFSLFGLLLLWMLPLHLWILRQQDRIHNIRRNIRRYPLYPLKLVLRFWRYSHRLFALAMLLLLLTGGVLEYVHLNQPENGLYSIAGSTGNMQWQRINTSPTQALLADTHGSIDDFTAGDHLHQLSGLDRNGAVRWTTFASEGVFSLPSAPTQPGTLLAALSGPSGLNYQFASDDPAYPHLQAHILNLYLLNRGTGQILWQSSVVRPDQQQDAVVLGADARFIYVAVGAVPCACPRETNAGVPTRASTVQLIAVNSSTGNIEWRIFGPQEGANAPIGDGSLLLQGRLIYWQIAGTLYSIDTTLGQIQWRRSIIEDDPNSLPAEEAQMAEAAGVLLVERSNLYHVLNAASGNELPGIPNPDTGALPSLSGVRAVGNMFLIYGTSTIEAVNAATQQVIWKQDNFDAIQGLKVSDDNKMVYVVQLNSVDQSLPKPVQALTALDLRTGSVRWTFQPSGQASFANPQSNGFQYSKGIVFATLCMPDAQSSCARTRLYAINAATGSALWKFEAKSIFDLQVSSDGGTVLLQTQSTEWINLIGRFRS